LTYIIYVVNFTKNIEEGTMIQGICLGNVMVDCDDEIKLRNFYAELLGWVKCEMYGRPAVRSDGGLVFLFSQEEDYVAPVWPEQAGLQQKQMHFDFQVPDVAAAVKQAQALGAVKAQAQFGGSDFVTMFDPAGHPFCLCAEG
jgi:predicted enzyme related to lactoylglutathione lyase